LLTYGRVNPAMHALISRSRTHVLALVAWAVVVAGCGTAATQPATSAQTTPDSTVSSQGSSTPDPSMPSGSTRLVLDPNNSQASYHAHEQLVGQSLPNEPVGTTHGVSGTLVLNADGTFAGDQSQVSVDLSMLQSDESRRDNFIKSNTLQTSQYPTATFVPTQVQGLEWPLPTTGQATFQVLGNLTVHGVTQPVVWQVTATFDGPNVSGDATTGVNISDFGMTPPKAGPVLSIQDALTLELAFSATAQS
jgi:polyisoprenoid-binding protein YceI